MQPLSNRWKFVAAVLPVVGISVALAGFTSPPFGAGPSYGNAMAMQCYSALVERCAAVCVNYSNPPSPSMGHLRLVQYKSQLLSMLHERTNYDSWWLDQQQSITSTNWMNPTNLLTRAGLPADFWTNTPLAGAATATNGWPGLRSAITCLVWTASGGFPSLCGGTNTEILCYSNTGCSVPMLEPTNLVGVNGHIPASMGRRNLGGGRRVTVLTTNCTFQYKVVKEEYNGTCPPDYGGASTDSYAQCGAVFPLVVTNGGPCDVDRMTIEYYTLTNTICDACDPAYLCGDKYKMEVYRDTYALSFYGCALITNVASEEVWTHGVLPITYDDDFGHSFTCLSGVTNFVRESWTPPVALGWTNSLSFAGSSGTLCVTNFCAPTNGIPWYGDTTEGAKAWALDDAIRVKKWNFKW